MGTGTDFRPQLAERVGLWVCVLMGAGVVAWTGFVTLSRLEAFKNGVSVPVISYDMNPRPQPGGSYFFEAEMIPNAIRIGLHGYRLDLEVARQYVLLVTVLIVVACLLLLARNTFRGRIFGRVNMILIAVAGIGGLVGFGAAMVIENLTEPGFLMNFERYGPISFHPLAGAPTILITIGFALVVVLYAYFVGARMQRDQEGLV